VPLHPARLRERGFNQSSELLRTLAAGLQLPADRTLLGRVSNRTHQRGSGQGRRRSNVRSVFAVRGQPLPERVLLVDDVVTTGATVRELARVLRQAGVREVDVLAVARTPRHGG
jgi:predicted amidophosphoribosyltransferase